MTTKNFVPTIWGAKPIPYSVINCYDFGIFPDKQILSHAMPIVVNKILKVRAKMLLHSNVNKNVLLKLCDYFNNNVVEHSKLTLQQ